MRCRKISSFQSDNGTTSQILNASELELDSCKMRCIKLAGLYLLHSCIGKDQKTLDNWSLEKEKVTIQSVANYYVFIIKSYTKYTKKLKK